MINPYKYKVFAKTGFKSMKNALEAMLDLRELPIQEIFGINGEKFDFSDD